ncbi:helix-turn-helix transcriptional regulator [Enemella sp. A6]|uniref:helix-turn-helix transcriptional regulator n=1 Tax=Enemella sp. A6 TaxID=3440152 RepID=UPI003EB70149
MSSLQQVPRLLALVPYLLRHPGARVSDVAREFGITRQQLLRDLQVLWFCGVSNMPDDLIDINMDQVEHEGVIHISNADFLSTPLVLSPTEALTLVVGLQSLRPVAGPDEVAVIDGALNKVRAALGPRSELADQVVIDVRSAADRVRANLDDALAERWRVNMHYQPDHLIEPQRRMVDPHSIAVRNGFAYLEAFDIDRQDWRSFRLDRIVDAVSTSIRAEDHGSPPSGDWLSRAEDAEQVELWLAVDALWATEHYPVEAVRPATAEESARVGREHRGNEQIVTMLITDPEWLVRLLLRLGPAARVLDARGWEDRIAEAGERARLAMAMHHEVTDRSGRVEP